LPDCLAAYGSEAADLEEEIRREPELGELIHPRLPYQKISVVWAARCEMARTVEDVLSRRTRALLLDAAAAVESAPEVARLLARELRQDAAWQDAQVAEFQRVAASYSSFHAM
jgi:glycerol-3-phosphate dehydrogenase